MDLEDESPTPDVPRRRRGAELEDALLDAAWDELVDRGYGGFTIDGVARRAGTSRPVLYRRWATKPELVRAAAERALRRGRATIPDTGTLRGDFLALLEQSNVRMTGTSALVAYYLGGYFQETGTSPADLRASLLGDGSTTVDVVVDRAVARGELGPEPLSPRVRSLLVDLFRHEGLMTLAPVPVSVREEMLDDIYLPLLRLRSGLPQG
ncbi:TetR/AcrR family transcriptional regulator [Luteimicrobium subarcticum]|uniref:TetR family transcriptional regulator n=1 Tax=Luteimicrobium subarcticum TaxID=620910 RepID=A0A2M8W6J3_9MICO|nr:TetR/AcrR family transcriptional regulator [Luteimicrobium subarcticum]PJI86546.1 TetR family transcriptional regulator [Luteimicrobium subarcticum]